MKRLLKSKILELLTFFIIIVVVVSMVTLSIAFKNYTSEKEWIVLAIQYNTWIMVLMVLLSIFVGYLYSSMFYKELKRESKMKTSILELVLKFLSEEEKSILNFLVENNGKASQADISRLEGLNKVKAYRSLQKMDEKGLIEITPYGKVRKIKLKENLFDSLKKSV